MTETHSDRYIINVIIMVEVIIVHEQLYQFKYSKLCERVKHVLERKKFEVYIAGDKTEARQIVENLIADGSVVSTGGSVTLVETGIMDLLRSGKYKFLDRYNAPDRRKVEIEAMSSDYYLCSANAITMNGELVFMDGFGNRVAAVTFGPKNVILVVGANKIVKNVEEARERIRYIAPMNAKRLSLSTPCAISGVCEDCASPQRICRHFHVINDCYNSPGRIKIIFVLQELGL